MEVMVTNEAKLQSNRHYQQTNIQYFYRPDALPVTQPKVKVKEVDLYTAFIEVPYTQGAQVRITQCYLQITPYLPLPRKHSPDGASRTEVADI